MNFLFLSFKCCYQIFYCQLHAYGILCMNNKRVFWSLNFYKKQKQKQKHEWYLIWNSVTGLSCGVFFLLKLLGCKSKYHILYNLYQFWILAIKHFHICSFNKMSMKSVQEVDTFSCNYFFYHKYYKKTWYGSMHVIQMHCELWLHVHNVNVNQLKILLKEVYYNLKNWNRSDCHFITCTNYFVNCNKYHSMLSILSHQGKKISTFNKINAIRQFSFIWNQIKSCVKSQLQWVYFKIVIFLYIVLS